MRPGFTHIKNCVAVGRAVASDDIIGAWVQIWSLEIWTKIFLSINCTRKDQKKKKTWKRKNYLSRFYIFYVKQRL